MQGTIIITIRKADVIAVDSSQTSFIIIIISNNDIFLIIQI